MGRESPQLGDHGGTGCHPDDVWGHSAIVAAAKLRLGLPNCVMSSIIRNMISSPGRDSLKWIGVGLEVGAY